MVGSETDFFGDKWLAGQPTYLTDLDRCQPTSALYAGAKAGHWRMVTYETDTLSGVMLRADSETDAPEITYPLGVSGWHAVSIAMLGESTESRVYALARLGGDKTFSMLTVPVVEREHANDLYEYFWKVADLTGQDLVLRQEKVRVASGEGPGTIRCADARIAYVKLVPLSDAEVSAFQADQRRTDTRRLFAHNDAHGLHYDSRPTTAEDIRRHIEMLSNTDISRLYWECGGGDLLFHLGTTARLPTYDGLDDFPRQGDRLHRESWQILRDKGINPFQVALDHTHDMGLEFHVSYRVSAFHSPPAHDHGDYGDSFYDRHPDLRGVDRDGNVTPRISYAYPETRRFVVEMLRELAGYDVDGVCLLYNRRPPLVEYEPPVVDGFKAEFGEDPRKLGEMDARWLSYRARSLTQFHRELRQAMDEEAKRQGRRRIEVTAVVLSSEQENLYRALDLKVLVDEGLVDTIIPYTSAPNVDGMANAWEDPRDAEYFVSLTKGTSCKLAFGLLPRQMPPESYRKRAAGLYGVGAESFFLWDTTEFRANYSDSWTAMRRLGHRDEIDDWVKAGHPRLATPPIRLRKLGDWNLSYATPG